MRVLCSPKEGPTDLSDRGNIRLGLVLNVDITWFMLIVSRLGCSDQGTSSAVVSFFCLGVKLDLCCSANVGVACQVQR